MNDDRLELEVGTRLKLKRNDIDGNEYFSEYEIESVAGKGASCIVYNAKNTDSKNPIKYIIKEFYPSGMGILRDMHDTLNILDTVSQNKKYKRMQNLFKNSFELMKKFAFSVGSANTSVKPIENIIQSNGTMYSISEWNDAQTLDKYEPKDLCDLVDILRKITAAVSMYHFNGYLHLDIKPQNVLWLDDVRCVKLFDYDTVIKESEVENVVIRSSYECAAPEVIKVQTQRIGITSDIYSIGVLLYKYLFGKVPDARSYMDLNNYDEKLDDDNGILNNLDVRTKYKLKDVLEKTVNTYPAKRYENCEELMKALDELYSFASPKEHELMNKVPMVTENFIGREDVFGKITENFENGKSVVFLKGEGGIGKTEAAIKYAKTESTLDSYFIVYRGTMRDTVLSMDFSNFEIKDYDGKEKTEEERYKEKIGYIKELGKDSLIIVDNFNAEDTDISKMIKETAFSDIVNSGVNLIFTTRDEFKINTIKVNKLEENELIRLMQWSCDSLCSTDVEVLKKIINAVDGNTLTVELVAKTIEESMGDIDAETMCKLMESANYEYAEFDEVSINKDKTNGFGESGKMYYHIKKLFDISGLSEEEKNVMQNMALTGVGGMYFKLFCKYKGGDRKTVKSLINRSWLNYDNVTNIIRLHPVICGVITNELDMNSAVNGEFIDTILADENVFEYVEIEQIVQSMKESLKYTDDVLLMARFHSKLGYLLEENGEYIGAEKYYSKALKIREENLPETHRLIAKSYNDIGLIYDELGKYKEAELYYKKALEIDEKSLTRIDSDLAAHYNNIGILYKEMGEYKKAEAYYQKSIKIYKNNLPEMKSNLANTYNSIGVLYADMNKYDKAEKYLKQAIKIREESLPATHPAIAYSYNNLGVIYADIGKTNQAETCIQKSIKIMKINLSATHPAIAYSYNNIGTVYTDMKKYKEAEKYLKQAIKIREESLPATHPDLASSYSFIGSLYRKVAQYEEAEKYLKQAIKIREESLPATHPDLAITYINIGDLYTDVVKYEKAEMYYQKAIAIFKENLPETQLNLAICYNDLGILYANEEEYCKAELCYQKAVQIQENNLPVTHIDLAISYSNIGDLYAYMWECGKSEIYYQKAIRIFKENLPESWADLMVCYFNVIMLCKKMKNMKKALQYYKQARDLGAEGLDEIIEKREN